MDSQVAQWLRFCVTIKPLSGTDVRGKKLYGVPRVLECYASGERKMVRNLEGKEVVSEETLYFDATKDSLATSHKDLVQFPDGHEPLILAIQVFRGERGQAEIVEVNF